MKLTILLLCLFSFSAIANTFSQQITLTAKNEKLLNVIKELRKQSKGYDFAFNAKTLDKSVPVTIELRGVDLDQALDAIFTGQPLQYEIKNKTILIKERFAPKNVPRPNVPTDETLQDPIRGRVTDSIGNPLAGVHVQAKGTGRQTTTDREGNYVLSGVARGAVLSFALVGYRTSEARADQQEMQVTLRYMPSKIDVVSVDRGYYTVSKELNTGSISTVSKEVIASQPVNDPLLALQGRVSGLYLQQTTGIPGSNINVRLRGRNSIANGNDPLYIVNGVPFTSQSMTMVAGAVSFASPFSTIGLDNIERIDVLKDADATAIYGSRGANGVILITTKKGQQGRTTFDLNYNRGFGKIADSYDLMNTEEFLEMVREGYANDNRTPTATDYFINGTWDTDRYTDWEKLMIGNTAHLNNLQGSLSGGSEHTQFLLSAGYRNETTVYAGDYRNRKISLQSNVNHRSANNKFNSNLTISFLNDNNLLPPSDLTSDITHPPNTPKLYNEDGSFNWENSTWQNPMASLARTSESVSENLNAALNMGYELYPGISLQSRFGYNTLEMITTNLTPARALDPNRPNLANLRNHTKGDNRQVSWMVEPSINFSKALDWGKVDAILGGTVQENRRDGLSIRVTGFQSDALMENIAAGSNVTINRTNLIQYRYSALYGRIGYTYKNRYILNVTGRRDGSSRFGPNNQFGNFGAIGVGWVFSKEAGFESLVPFLNFGKLRASYGITGNDQLTDYQYLSTYTATGTNTYQGIVGLNPTRHANPLFGWETVKKLEAAIELGLFEDRIRLDVNWYRNRTGNQLVGYPLPGMTGFPSVQANLPAVVQNTGVEFDLSADVINTSPFNWNISGNLSVPRNKLISYPDLETSSYANQYVIGMPLFIGQRYRYIGIDPETGIYTFEDMNNDGAYTNAHDRYPVFVGQKWFGGINNQFTYKGFDLSIFFQFVNQTGINGLNVQPGAAYPTQGNLPRRYLDRWQQPGDDARYQRYSADFAAPASQAQSRYFGSDAVVENASFIKLRNVALSYQLPQVLCRRFGIDNLRVYVQGQNLLTLTSFSGLDPERSGSLGLPSIRMITSGIQFTIR